MHARRFGLKCDNKSTGAKDVFETTLGKLAGAERRLSERTKVGELGPESDLLFLGFTGSAVCVASAKKNKPSACRLMFNVIIGRVIQLVHVAVRAPTQLHDYADPPAFFFLHVS